MKKIIRNICIIVLELASIVCFTAAGKQIYDIYDVNNAVYKCYIDVKTEDNISKDRIKEVKKQLQFIPESMQQDFLKSDWSFTITSEDLNEKYFDGKYLNVNGVTLTQDEQIFVRDTVLGTHIAPVHEFGHWYDVEHGILSQTEEFLKIYNSEKDNLQKEFAADVSSEMEFFAEGFQVTLKHPERVKNETPILYKYMMKNVFYKK